MTIEIHTPELEDLLQQRMQSGGFHNVDDLLIHLLRQESSNQTNHTAKPGPRRTRAEAAAHMREARRGNRLPEGVTIRGLIDKGRA